MASRRMFAEIIIRSDAFLRLPASTRCLYFDLMMETDDDGFINNPEMVIRISNAKKSDLTRLITTGFVYRINKGLVLIKHFKTQNSIQPSRKKQSKFAKYLKRYQLDDVNAYQLIKQKGLLDNEK